MKSKVIMGIMLGVGENLRKDLGAIMVLIVVFPLFAVPTWQVDSSLEGSDSQFQDWQRIDLGQQEWTQDSQSTDYESFGASEPPATEWNKTYGGIKQDEARDVEETTDEGYVLVGHTFSISGNRDLWLVKTDARGNQEWNKSLSYHHSDGGTDVEITSDGGFVITGYTAPYAGWWDFWLIKTDAYGNEEWNQTYGGTDDDYPSDVEQTEDGGFIIAGGTESFGDHMRDIWLIKTDGDGNMEWNKTYDGGDVDTAFSVERTSDGGYILVGDTWRNGSYDVWLIKTDDHGNKEWERVYGGAEEDVGWVVRQTTDGGYVVAGDTTSFSKGGEVDFWLVRVDANGNHLWNRTFGGEGYDIAFDVELTEEEGYILAGQTTNGDNYDFWLVKTDADGNQEWNKTLGGPNHERAYAVETTSDGGYVVAGRTDSYGAGDGDFWLIKLAGFPTLITDPEVERLPFRLSFEPVDGDWSKDLIVRFFDITARPIDMLLKLLYEEPYDQVFGEIWHLPTILLADKNGDGPSYDEILEWLKERMLGQLKDRIMEYAIECYYTITSTNAYLLEYINLENLATALFMAVGLTGAVMAAGISISLAPQINVATTFGIFGIQYPAPEWMETGTWVGPGQNRIYAMSPVDLYVVDSLGRVVNKTLCQIPEATYIERDFDGDGNIDDLITLPDDTMNYSVTVEPEMGASPNETFTLIAANGVFGVTLAQDVEVQNITETGYILQTYDSEFLDLITPSTPSVGGIWIPVNKLELLAPYIGSAILLAVAVTTVVYVKKRKRNTRIIS